jgi:hypothetical protein
MRPVRSFTGSVGLDQRQWSERGRSSRADGRGFIPSERAVSIGLDETGKGELVGHLTLVRAVVPARIRREVQEVIGPADTKKRHSANYWDALFARLHPLRRRGLDFVT